MVDVVVDEGVVGPVEDVYSDVVSGIVVVLVVVVLVDVDDVSDVDLVDVGRELVVGTVVCVVVTIWHVLPSNNSKYPDIHTQFEDPGPA